MDTGTLFTLPLAAGQAVSTSTTVIFGLLLAGLIACLALEEKIHAKKSVIAAVFAFAGLFLAEAMGIYPQKAAVDFGGHELPLPLYIPPINWEVIAIILGSGLFVDITSKSGLFTWIAIKLTKASGGDPRRLLYFYGVMTVVFSAVLNNVTAMIIVGSLTAVSLDRLERKEQMLGFLLVEALLTNVGGLLTLISSVPNIIVGSAAGISFVDFFLAAAPYVVVTTGITLAMGARMFGIQRLRTAEEKAKAAALVATFDENDGIDSKGFFWFGTAMLLLFILVIATTSVLPVVKHLGMGFVALVFAGVMLLRFKSTADRFYQTIDWDLLGFFAALFVFLHVVEAAKVLDVIGGVLEQALALGPIWGTALILVGAAVFSSVTDNIPLAAMLANVLTGLQAQGVVIADNLWWAVVFGANLGGNLTPIGSASTLVAVTIMHRHKIPMSFGGFVKSAVPYAAVQIALAALYVLFVL